MAATALEVKQIDKMFFQTRALSQVSMTVERGTVLGLVGENGAGKSTLMNILGGVVRPDSGTMTLGDAPYAPQSAREATDRGVAVVHQELNLFPNLSIAENLFLTEMPCKRRLGIPQIDRRRLRQDAQRILEAVGLELNPELHLSRLTPGERQLVEIAKAIRVAPALIIFDEPTTSLGQEQTRRLFQIIDQLRSQGTAVIYISHSLGDVLRLSDTIVVLRDGQVQAMGKTEDFTVDQLISKMVGRNIDTLYPKRASRPADVVLEVDRICKPGVVQNISFTLRRGEVLGISGLMGSGRTELARILFGLDAIDRGEIRIKGQKLASPTPRQCIHNGMGFLTEDRRREGLLVNAGVEDNVALAALDQYCDSPIGPIQREPLRRRVAELVESLGIQCADMNAQSVRTLSGGNQQKVVLAKWLHRGADVLILDEPTRGIDVGAKVDIYDQIRQLTDSGSGILLISSELEELIGLSDRILVMARGEIQTVVERADFDRSAILRSALGKERLR